MPETLERRRAVRNCCSAAMRSTCPPRSGARSRTTWCRSPTHLPHPKASRVRRVGEGRRFVRSPTARGDAPRPPRKRRHGDDKFDAGAREGAAVAGRCSKQVNFPASSAADRRRVPFDRQELDRADGGLRELVADVAKSLNQFRDDNTSENQGRDHLVEQFPDLFQLTMDAGDFGPVSEAASATTRSAPPARAEAARGRRRKRRGGACQRRCRSTADHQARRRTVEAVLVPAARTQLAQAASSCSRRW